MFMSKKIYVRKFMKHDITHEVSLTSYVYYEFFLGEEEVQFQIEGESRYYNVTFNNATDLRFGGDFKAICRKLGVKEGDYFLIYPQDNGVHLLSLLKSYDAIKSMFYPFFTGTRRHMIAVIENDSLLSQYIR